MRAAAVALLFVVPVLAGCLGDGGEKLQTDTDLPIALDQIRIPDGAELIEETGAVVLRLANVTFPFREVITIPEGASIVRLEATLPEHPDLSVYTYMVNNETGRRRCNPDSADTAWNVYHRGGHLCSGMTAIDPPGSEWRVQVTGSMLLDDQGPVLNEVDPQYTITPPNLVRIVYVDEPVDGFAAQLDLTRLSMPTHELQETTGQYVTSFDDTELWVEVTLPEGEGPFPTIISSSPYNGQYGRLGQPGGEPAMWEYWTHDWAKRGYAAINVDVRGFGLSGGCVEVWGENEQKDQSFIVDWVADQPWSDGKVGFYGQSYVGTTPVAAAVQNPEALKAIIAVAPVINAYNDWHYGGVPNGENTLSPVSYQVLTDQPPTPNPFDPDVYPYTDPVTFADNIGKGVCDPTLMGRANDPRAVYDAFYEERDFSLRAGDIKAAVLYTEGFEDANVKSAMIPGWFNEIQSPKLGVFGHWVHQHPTRADEEILFLGWMDQYVKGKDLGFDKLPNAEIVTNKETHRTAETWPTPDMPTLELWPDYAGGTLSEDADAATGATLAVGVPDHVSTPVTGIPVPDGGQGAATLTVTYPVTEDFAITGTPHLHVRGTLKNGGNAFLGATLYERDADGTMALITYGAYNLAHDETHTTWNAVTGASDVKLPFLPTEYVFTAGNELVVVLYAIADDPYAQPGLGLPVGQFVLGEHPDGVAPLVLDTVPMDLYEPLPRTGQR